MINVLPQMVLESEMVKNTNIDTLKLGLSNSED
jgi:hypothetical protein